jgi:hypothetical protein
MENAYQGVIFSLTKGLPSQRDLPNLAHLGTEADRRNPPLLAPTAPALAHLRQLL